MKSRRFNPDVPVLLSRLLACLMMPVLLLSSGCSFRSPLKSARLPENVGQNVQTMTRKLDADPATLKGGAQATDLAARQQREPEVVRYGTQPWVATSPLPFRDDQRLPEIFYQPFSISHASDDSGISIDMLALRISQTVRVPVRVLPDVYTGIKDSVVIDESEAQEIDEKQREEEAKAASGSGRKASAQRSRFLRYEPLEIPPHLLRWKGNLRGFLNHLTDRLDLSWSLEEGVIVLSRFQTETFELAMFPVRGKFDVSTTSRGVAGGSRGGSGGAAGGGSSSGSTGSASAGSVAGALTMGLSEEGLIDAYDSVLKAIGQMIETVPGSRMFVTQGSGRVVVRSSRVMLRSIREMIRSENNSLTRQVIVQLDIYNIISSGKRQFGADWSVIQNRLFPGVNAVFRAGSSSGGSAGITVTQSSESSQDLPRITDAMITSFTELGYNVQHRPLSILAMNRQWVRKSRLLSQSYLAETTPATASAIGGGTGVPGLKAASITVGDQIMLMPYVLENNSVLLKLGLTFSDLLGLDRIETGEGPTKQLLQIPSTATAQDNVTVQMRPGELVAISGLTNNTETQSRRVVTESFSPWLGGLQTDERKQQHFLVFLRVVLL